MDEYLNSFALEGKVALITGGGKVTAVLGDRAVIVDFPQGE